MKKYSLIFLFCSLLFMCNTLTAQESYYSETGKYTITGVVKKKFLVENSNVDIAFLNGGKQLKGIVIKKENKTYVEGKFYFPHGDYLKGVFQVKNDGEFLVVKHKNMGNITITNVEIKTAKISKDEGWFLGTVIPVGNNIQDYVLKEGTFQYNSGEIFIGDLTKTYAGIPIAGELTLKDGSKKVGDWLSPYNFTSSEYEMIQEKEKISEKMFVVKNLELYHQAKNRAEIAEQEENYSSALELCRDALEYLKLLERTSSFVEEMETRLLYKKTKQEAQQAEYEKNYSLALEKYNEAQKYNTTNIDDDIRECIERVQSQLDEEKRIASEQQKKSEEEAKNRKRQRLVNKYGTKWADLIEKKELAIGMPRDAVFEFMPEHVYVPNKITTGTHVTETYRINMDNAYLWVISKAKNEGGDAGLRLLYEQAMMIKMFGGNPDIYFEKAIREMLPKLVFIDGKLSSFSSY
ncbi:MAG: hypothetical protein K5860_06085 [Bacteroidales bacterium]|nr:hypothetical protein [Bacteroidales bacterium]